MPGARLWGVALLKDVVVCSARKNGAGSLWRSSRVRRSILTKRFCPPVSSLWRKWGAKIIGWDRQRFLGKGPVSLGGSDNVSRWREHSSIILDEATSVLDPDGEESFIAKCRTALAARTVILITLRSVRSALSDRVMQMTAGGISDSLHPLQGTGVKTAA